MSISFECAAFVGMTVILVDLVALSWLAFRPRVPEEGQEESETVTYVEVA